MHPVKGLAHRAAHRQRAMVAQDQRFALTQVLQQGLLLLQVQHHALVVVIANLQKAHGRLRQRQQPAVQRGHSHRRPAVRVDHAVHVMARGVHRAVDHVAGLVDAVVHVAKVRLGQDGAVQVHLDQAGRRDLFVHHPVGVDEERVVFARHAGRDVVGHHVGHAVKLDQPVTGGQIDTGLPFLVGTVRPHGSNGKRARASGVSGHQLCRGPLPRHHATAFTNAMYACDLARPSPAPGMGASRIQKGGAGPAAVAHLRTHHVHQHHARGQRGG